MTVERTILRKLLEAHVIEAPELLGGIWWRVVDGSDGCRGVHLSDDEAALLDTIVAEVEI